MVRSGLYSVNSCNLWNEKEEKEREWKLQEEDSHNSSATDGN